MKLLSIETSCDETSAGVVEKKSKDKSVKILSNITASSVQLHAQTGGIIPEKAAREQIKYILPVIIESLHQAQDKNTGSDKKSNFSLGYEIFKKEIDAIAVTVGPGLIGSLLVGVETAKTLSYVFNKPLIPVNHLLGHIYANFIRENPKSQIRNPKLNAKRYTLNAPRFPFIGLIVSGGHTDLLYFKKHGEYTWLGGTRDDASGEALDKIARILNLPYPGGPEIEKRAKKGKKGVFSFKSPMIETKDFDFSFSGLKTQVAREVKKQGGNRHSEFISESPELLDNQTINNFCFSVQDAIVKVLVKKTIKAAQKYRTSSIIIGGGVSANEYLRDQFELEIRNLKLEIPFFFPEKWLCTDNAAMIGAYALFNNHPVPWQEIKSEPELYFA